jgi:tetratricopeptide (TPR) repeat protein
MKIVLSLLLMLTFCIASSAEKKFDFNLECQRAYQEILKLKLESAQALLNAEKIKSPDNLVPFLLENYIDFFILFFNEDPAEYKRRLPKREKRLSMLEQGPQNSPYYLFSSALVHFQWAVIKIKFGHNWDAGWEFRRSFLQVKNNTRKFPDFVPNTLFRGAMQVAAGTIPDGYRWLSNMLGIKGSIGAGMQQLRSFLDSGDPMARLYREEAIFYYCYLSYYIENEKEAVLRFVYEQKLDLVNNHLFAYLGANLNTHSQRAETALEILNNRNNSPAYFHSPVWDLQKGYILLYKGSDDAVIYLERFVRNFKGRYYMKDALQKISWYYYLKGDIAKATYYRKQIPGRSTSDSEADKQAHKEAVAGTWPDTLLLRARLMSDGGYHRAALGLLHGKSAAHFARSTDKLEFTYRVGKIYDDLGRHTEALKFYLEAVKLGRNSKEYYAARAALQIAFIYEARKDCNQALQWFAACTAMKDHDYKNGIDQRAKAGMKRCKPGGDNE